MRDANHELETEIAALPEGRTSSDLTKPRATSAVSVSVVIPAFNAACFIGETIASILRQSYSNYEIIVVNDGSPDTADLERAIEPYRPHLVYLAQRNGGPSAARNYGIREAQGEYIAFLDSDDVWMPQYLERQLGILAAGLDIDLLYSNGTVIGDVDYAGRDLMSLAPSRGPVTFERLMTLDATVLTSCVIARRQSVIDAGMFDERFRRSEDFHLWARMAHRGARIEYHRQILVQHRRRQGSLSDDRTAMTLAAIDVLRDLEASLPLTPRERIALANHIARCRAYLAHEEARRLFIQEQYSDAAAAFERVRALEPGRWHQRRARLLQIGLTLAPRVMRWTYSLLRGPLTTSSATAATRFERRSSSQVRFEARRQPERHDPSLLPNDAEPRWSDAPR